MNGRIQMQGGKNWIFPKEMNTTGSSGNPYPPPPKINGVISCFEVLDVLFMKVWRLFL
jgi:hypothetical protein